MSRVYVKTERVINASPNDVYSVLVDYKTQRPRMLTSNFLDYAVEKGGRGTGTVISYVLRAANRQRPYKMRVDESVKGEVVTERDLNSSLVTTWSLLPLHNGRQTKVRVASEWEGSSGTKGFFEKTFAPLGLRSVYNEMLNKMQGVVSNSAVISDEEVTAVQGVEGSPLDNIKGLGLILVLVLAAAFAISLLQRKK